MADTIDSISIELTASTQSAEKSIQRVIDALRMLQAAAIDASAESRIGKSIRSIAKAAKEVDSDAGQKLARLAGGLNALSKVRDLSNLADAGKNLSSVVRAVNSMGQSGGKGLSGLANGIKQTSDALGGIKDADVSKLNAVKDALSGEMSGSLHSSSRASESASLGGMGSPEPSFGSMAAYGAMTVFKFTADSIRDATMAYREFGAALADGGSTVDTQFTDSMMTVFKYTADSIRDATAAYREFQATLGSGVPPIFTNFADDAARAGGSVRMLTGNVGSNNEGPWVADEIRDAARAYDDVGNSASRAADVIETEFVNPFANFKMKPLEDELPRVTLNPIDGSVADSVNNAAGAFGNLSNVLGGLSGLLGPVASGLIAIPKYFGGQLIGNIQKATKGLTGFFHSIVRIAKYRLIRSALRMITQGINQGMKNLYAFSQVASGTFAASMDRIATASQYLGNSFAAMASPLVEALAPAIDFVVDKVVAMFNTISQVIARLTGKSTYTAAKKVAATWSGAAQSAGKGASDSAKEAVDEIKRTIMGFDEINKLNEFADNASGGGSGGSGGGGGSGAGAMFEELPIDSEISNFADALKEAFLAGDWQELGTLLGTKVNELVDSIDWAGAGATVGYYINGWFSTEYWTLDTINFTNIGSKIAEFLNNAINEIDFNILGRLMVQKLTIIGDLVIGFFETFDWGQTAEKLSDFVKGLYEEIAKWFNKYDWSEVGTAIADGLVDFIANIDYGGIANSMYEALSAAFEAGAGLLSGFFDGLADRFKATVNWDSLSDEVKSVIEGIMAVLGTATLALGAILAFSGANIPLGIGLIAAGAASLGTSLSLQWDGLSNTVKEKIEILKGVVSGAALVIGAILTFSGANIPLGLGLLAAGGIGLAGTLGENWDAITNKIKEVCGNILTAITTWWEETKAKVVEVGGNIWNGILTGITNAISGIGTWIKTNIFDPFLKWLKSVFGIASPAKTMEEPGKNIVLGIFQGIINALKNVGQWVKDNIFDPIWGAISAAGATVIEITVSLVKKVGEWAADAWEAVKSGAETIVKTVNAIFSEVGTWAGNVWNAVKAGAETIVKTVNAIFSEVGTWAGSVWDAVKAGAETIVKTVNAIFSEVGSWSGKVWEAVKNGAETIVKTVNAIFSEVGTWAGNVWNAVKAGAETIVKTVNAIFSEVGTWAGSVWTAVKNGAETILKTVQAVFSEVGSWAGNVWDTVKAGTETIIKTVTAGMQVLSSWVSDIVDFILGPDAAQKNASIAMTIENVALSILNFLRDPATALKNVMLELGVKFAKGVEKFWNWITGSDGQSEVVFDAYGNMMIVPKAGEGLTDNGNGQFSLTKDIAGTTVLSPTIDDDSWQKSWDELVGDELNVPVKINGVAGTGIGEIGKTNKLTPFKDSLVSVNAEAGSGISSLGSKNSLNKFSNSDVTIDAKQGWLGTIYSALKIEDLKTNVAIGVNFLWAAVGILAFIGLSNLSATVSMSMSKTWKNTPLEWLGLNNLSATVSMSMSKTWKNSALAWLGLDNLSATVSMSMKKSWKNSALAWLGLDNLKSSVDVSLKKGWSGTLKGALGLSDMKVTATVSLKKGSPNKIVVAKNGSTSWQLQLKKLGGVFANGIWRNIAQYANGTTNAQHGSLFLAGESGPEMVGHVGGRTEVLNQSQLAATMYAAVHKAMQGVKINASFYNADAANSESDYETMYRAMYDAFTDAMAGSNERDREKVALMRQIAAKEFTAEVTAASVNRAQTRMNRRAGTTIVPVGT